MFGSKSTTWIHHAACTNTQCFFEVLCVLIVYIVSVSNLWLTSQHISHDEKLSLQDDISMRSVQANLNISEYGRPTNSVHEKWNGFVCVLTELILSNTNTRYIPPQHSAVTSKLLLVSLAGLSTSLHTTRQTAQRVH